MTKHTVLSIKKNRLNIMTQKHFKGFLSILYLLQNITNLNNAGITFLGKTKTKRKYDCSS